MEGIGAILASEAGEISESSLILTMMSVMLIAGICSVIFTKLKLPPIIGYLLAGILIVNVFNLKENELFSMETLEVLKNIGLVMLMFGIGTELSIDKIKKCGKFAALVAIIQLPLMVLSGYIFGMMLFGMTPVVALTLGAVISGSSTAVVVAVLKTSDRISKEDAETLILVTIVEDIGQVIILSIMTPIFASGSMDMDVVSMVGLILKIIVFMAVSVVVGIKLVPKVLNWVGDNTNAEVLLVLSVGLCFFMAFLSTQVGMSMAIGAFLMGVMVSQSKYSHEVQEKTEPMKEVFMAVFFISVGMDVTFDGFVNCLPLAVGIALLFMISKFVTVYLGYFVGGKNFEITFVSSISLMAMGEFAFIITDAAGPVVGNDFKTAVIGAALITMITLPVISKWVYQTSDAIRLKSPAPILAAGNRVYGVRDEIREKMDAAPSTKEFMMKNLKKTYFCILIMIIIEIIFASFMPSMIDFLSKLLEEYLNENSRLVAYILLVACNFILLVIPTYSLIASIKSLDRLMLESEKKLVDGVESEEDKAKYSNIYRKFLDFSTLILVIVIDFVIMAIVPGPFGFEDKSSLLAIPIAIAILLIGIILSRRKEAIREASETIKDTRGEIDEAVEERKLTRQEKKEKKKAEKELKKAAKEKIRADKAEKKAEKKAENDTKKE